MSDDEDRRDLEETAALFVGHAISRVRYMGAWQEAPEEPGGYVEFVEITMDDGAVLRVSTDPDEFGNDGISIYEGAYPTSPFDEIHVLEAGTRGGWGPLLGPTVIESTIHWTEVESAYVRVSPADHALRSGRTASLGTHRATVPSALELRFDGGQAVTFAAAAWASDGSLISDADNVAIVFGDVDAERLRVGRWRPGREAPPAQR